MPNASGAIDPHETLRDAAIRETKEEVGLQVLQKDLTLVHTLHALTEGDEWIGEFFITNKWTGKEGVQEPHKHSEIRWVALDNLSGEFIP